jgi:hypothetical protein
VHVPRFTAYKSFVRFTLTREQVLERSLMKSETDTMVEKPSRLLSDPKCAMNLITADSVLAANNEPHRHQPFVQSDRRVLHDCAGLTGELAHVMLCAALPAVVLRKEHNLLASATRAGDAIGPASRYEVRTAVVRIGKIEDRFLKRFRFLSNASSVPDLPGFIKSVSTVKSQHLLLIESKINEFQIRKRSCRVPQNRNTAASGAPFGILLFRTTNTCPACKMV